MGVVGAFLIVFPRNNVEMVLWVIWFKTTIGYLSSFWMILLWVAWDVCTLAIGLPTNVALTGHLAGFASGFIVTLLLAATGIIRPKRHEQTLLLVLRSVLSL